MRIAVIHSFYTSSKPSGENRVVEDQVDALRDAGHDVILVRQDTPERQGPVFALRSGVNVALGHGFDPSPVLKSFKPDIVHIHNLFPNFSTNWLRTWPGPFVVTLHNYRFGCSNGIFYRSGNICTECPDSGNYRGVIHGCYRDSRLATIPLAVSQPRRHEVLDRASAIVTTSELSTEIVRKYLRPNAPLHVVPNFVDPDDSLELKRPLTKNWLTLGRFSAEKGFVELVKDWPADERLTVVGDGELRSEILQSAAGKLINVRSSVPRDELRLMISDSYGLIFPSRWFESDPQVVAESMRLGLPVVAFHANSAAELVGSSGSGVVYRDSASLRSALDTVVRGREQMSINARGEYLRRWTKQSWLIRIENLYRELLG
jgi:glycosyltransferase involved in cell wall biosynthesis